MPNSGRKIPILQYGRILSGLLIFSTISFPQHGAAKGGTAPAAKLSANGTRDLQRLRAERFFTRGNNSLPRSLGAQEWAKLLEQRRSYGALRSRTKPLAAASSSTQSPAELPGFQLRPTIRTGAVPTSVAVGDFNGDGKQDMVIANGYDNNLWLYPGKGDGTFGVPTIIPLTQGLSPDAVVAADLRGTGKLDLIVADYDSWSISVFLGNGDGTFSHEYNYPTTYPPTAVAVADFNGDGHLDVAVTLDDYSYQEVSQAYDLAIFFGDGKGAFAPAKLESLYALWSAPWNLVAADLNGDGHPDLIATDPSTGGRVWLNDGNGNFSDEAGGGENDLATAAYTPTWTAVGDLNGDGCPDAVTTFTYLRGFAAWDALAVRLGDCHGNFGAEQMYPVGATPYNVELADVNGDGILDAITTSFPILGNGQDTGDVVSVLLGDGKGGFSVPRVYRIDGPSPALALADLTGDGRISAITINPLQDAATVLPPDGKGGFGDPQGVFFWTPGGASGQWAIYGAPVFQDLNGDGSKDILITMLAAGLQIAILLNDGTGHFVTPPSVDSITLPSAVDIGGYQLGDFRNRGKPDLVIAGGSTQYLMFVPNNGDGTFGAATITNVPNASGPLAVGDFNRDGNLDVATVHQVFLGNGDGTFRPGAMLNYTTTVDALGRLQAVDVNHDGKLDLISTDGNFSTLLVLLGNGDGTFQPSLVETQPKPGTQDVLADINNDGIPDLLSYYDQLPNSNSGIQLYEELGQNTGQFAATTTFDTGYAGYSFFPYFQFAGPQDSFSTAAHLRGSQPPDVIVFQRAAEGGEVYAQILANNGDGTFLATNDIFPLGQSSAPQFAVDLDGDGKADLVEVDQFNASLNVMKAVPAAEFQIELDPGPFSGSSGGGTVYLNSPTAGGTVSLSTTAAGVVLPASITIPPGQSSGRFTVQFESGFNPLQAFDVTATMDGQSATTFGSHSYSAGFTAQFSGQMQQSIYEGQNTSAVTITLSSVNGYSSTVDLDCPQATAAITCSFSPASVTVPAGGSATATLTLTTNSYLWDQPVMIRATDGIYAQYGTFTISATLLRLSAGSTKVFSPGTAVFPLETSAFQPFTMSCSGLPPGASCTFNGDQGVTVQVPNGIAPGDYPFTVGISSLGLTATSPATLSVIDFNLQPLDAADSWAPAGGDSTRTLMVQWANTTPLSQQFSCVTSWGGACNGQGTAPSGATDFVVTVPAGTPTGSGTISFRDEVDLSSNPPEVRSATLPFAIASVSGKFSDAQLSVSRGGSGNATLMLSADAGFSGAVSLSCSAPVQLQCALSASSVNLTAQSLSSSVTVKVTAGASAQNFRPIVSRGDRLWLAILGIPLLLATKRRRLIRSLCLVLLVIGLLPLSSCGGGGSTVATGTTGNGGGGGGTQPSTYQVTVQGSLPRSYVSVNLGTLSVTVD
ncbi:MAG TPA: VCBS repeat-containing protein [Terracidiphilus sp.]|nr:VCBS repeat-containing protein [Terracidiphilus sp.]